MSEPTVRRFSRFAIVFHWMVGVPYMALLASGGLILLQRTDRGGQRRLDDIGPPGRARKMLLFGRGDEMPELAQIHDVNLSHFQMKTI